MSGESLQTLQARYDQLQQDMSFDAWRQLSRDVLGALIEQQSRITSLQRLSLDMRRSRQERDELRAGADAAFAIVQQLHRLRRKVHDLAVETRRASAANDGRLSPFIADVG